MKKRQLLLLGLITLVVFPLPTFLIRWWLEDLSFWKILELNHFRIIPLGYGIIFGTIYAFIAMLAMRAPIFERMPGRMEHLVRALDLTLIESIFLALCAGIGEELLFRSGMQAYLGPIITSVFFVAIHGYLNPWNKQMSLYGLIVLPFILLLSYGFDYFGLWFAIAAHAMYDYVLFRSMSSQWD